MEGLQDRLQGWVEARDYMSLGNLGEHVTARLLDHLGYQVLACQSDLDCGLEGEPGAHPEDLLCIAPDFRLTTVNSKVAVGAGSCRLTRNGNLTAPRMGRGQRWISYYSRRAGMFQELNGDSFGLVVKVDLRHLKAQLFELSDTGRLIRSGPLQDVAGLVTDILATAAERLGPLSATDYL